MKMLRTPLIVITSLATLSAGAWLLQAQEKSSAAKPSAPAAQAAQPEHKPGPLLERAGDRLGLSAEQKEKLAALRDRQRAAMKAIRDDASLSPEQKREKMRESFKSAREEAGAVFTPEQKGRIQKFRHRARARMHHAMRARMHHRMAQWHGHRGGFGHHRGPALRGPQGHGRGGHGFMPGRHHGPPQGMGFAPQFRRRGPMPMHQGGPGFGPQGGRGPGSFGGGLDLTDEQKTKLESLQKAQREKMAESMKSFQEQFRAILTPEQQQQLDARRGPRPPEKP